VIVNEIFHSIQGESTRAGLPCVFVRLTGCHLRCVYCDSAHAFYEGSPMNVEDVESAVARFGCRYVTITGGEPLLQEDVHALMARLASTGFEVQLETSGSRDVSLVDARVRIILDVKTPGSGESAAMAWENLSRLKPGDEVKFVLMGRDDYRWAREVLRTRNVPSAVEVLLSPAHGTLDPRDLAEWMKEDGMTARLQLQIHKYIWAADRRGV
jgi:7-carboxy-7-deazaguanine synthase